MIFGEAFNISQSGQDRGLPQTNSGYVLKVASGDTSDPEVFAFRLGTVINIVNGGLECNKAAQWHNGPLQRVSYYNAYAAYFNEKYSDDYKISVPRIKEATNVWTDKVSAISDLNLQSATCYNQKFTTDGDSFVNELAVVRLLLHVTSPVTFCVTGELRLGHPS